MRLLDALRKEGLVRSAALAVGVHSDISDVATRLKRQAFAADVLCRYLRHGNARTRLNSALLRPVFHLLIRILGRVIKRPILERGVE